MWGGGGEGGGGGGGGVEVVISVSGQMAYLGEGRVFLGDQE